MKAKQFREMATGELVDKIGELHTSLFELRTQAATEKLENNKAVTNMRRDIARIKTILRERQ
jgi:large subunit ribosomal protein L29